MVFGPMWGWLGFCLVFFLYCRVRHDLGWALLEPCTANNFEDCPKNCWCFLGWFSCGMFVSADAAPSGACLHPWYARENLCSKGPPWCGKTLCARTKEDCISSGREREGRGLRGSFRGTAGMYWQPHFPVNLPVVRVLCGSRAGDKIYFYCVQILSGEYLIWFP